VQYSTLHTPIVQSPSFTRHGYGSISGSELTQLNSNSNSPNREDRSTNLSIRNTRELPSDQRRQSFRKTDDPLSSFGVARIFPSRLDTRAKERIIRRGGQIIGLHGSVSGPRWRQSLTCSLTFFAAIPSWLGLQVARRSKSATAMTTRVVWKILKVFVDGAENCQINAGVVARRNESATAMTTRVV
jgi:hypothetical protein